MSGKSFALEKLHGEEVNLASVRFGSVNLVDQADVRMTHFECAFQFRRQQALETELSRLNRDAHITFAINSFVNHAHPALADYAHNLETAFNHFTWAEQPAHCGEGDQGLLQEAAHVFFPLQRLDNLLVQAGVRFTQPT